MGKTKTPSPTSPDALANAAAKSGLAPAALAAARAWLVEQLMAQEYAKLGQGGHTLNEVPLRRVFIDLPVTDSLSSAIHQTARVLFLGRLLSSDPLYLRNVCSPSGAPVTSAQHALEEEEPDERGVETIGREQHRDPGFSATLLIGGPGQGKSTLGQLACQLHRASLLRPVESELTSTQRELVRSFVPVSERGLRQHSLGLPKNPLLPLQIALPELAAWLAKEQASERTGGAPALLRFLASLPSARINGLGAEHLLELACQMPSLLVLDGFDEVGASEDRERIVAATRDLIAVLLHRNAAAQVIATTRPQGYAGELAQIGLPLQERYLAPLLRHEALEYAQKLVKAKIPGADQQEKTLERLTDAAREPATERLLTTPLQVTILTALLQQLGRAPRERWNLFSRYFAYTYDREIERETYASRLLAEHRAHIERIHARVALLLQVEAERDGGASARMSRARLAEVIDAVLSEDEVADDIRKGLVRDIAAVAEQRLVFLVEPEPGAFGFEIRSLQEFMAAWALTSGRDAEVEARLLQVAKAPMFRNVALFVASKLFSEGSPLRDVLADRVCGSLDEDSDDELARLTRSGALLALETLEEGAALSQPKRARALMERATRLLGLPPGSEHGRLARAANSDTALILRDAVGRSIGGLTDEWKEGGVLAAWVCLIEGTNRYDTWATELGELLWPRLAESTMLLSACARSRIPLGPWVARKIQESAETFYPEDVIRVAAFAGTEDGKLRSWVSWLCAIYANEGHWSRRRGHVPILSLAALGQPITPAELISPTVAPSAWRDWIAAARFEIEPNANTLADALQVVADWLPRSRWKALEQYSSWPLAACLASAEGPGDLHQFAKALRLGDLGHIAEWRSAEDSWRERADFMTVLQSVPDGLPWSRPSLKLAPPFAVLPVWWFEDRSPKRQAAHSVRTLEQASRLFRSSRSPALRRWLAELCLFLVPKLSERATGIALDIADWLAVLPDGIRYLVPRPRRMGHSEWLDVLNAQPPYVDDLPPWSSAEDPEALCESLVEAELHPVVLRLAVLGLASYFQRYRSRSQPTSAQLRTIETLLDEQHAGTPATRASSAILRILIGALPAERDEESIAQIAAAAVSDRTVWDTVLNAIRGSGLSVSREGAILARVYREMGARHPDARFALEQLREMLQTRRSGLENYTTWNQLALSLPYPQPPFLPRMDGRIPSHPVSIESLELRDVRGLHQLKLVLIPPGGDGGQWTVILGPNGIGKTTLLRGLVLALRNTKDPAIWPKGSFGSSWLRVASIGEPRVSEARVTVKLADGVEHETLIRSNGSTSVTQLPEQNRPRLFPVFAYGCRRGSALGGAARQVDLRDDEGPEIATLFDEGADLIHAETWLLQLEGDAQKNPRSKAIFGAVTDAMKVLLSLVAMEVSDRKVWVTEDGGPRLPFSSLSDGYLTSAGWFLDLVARWVTLAEGCNEGIESDFLTRMRGLVLIDEFDLHLHPRWQIEIIARTRRLLPQMSFIVTTHNPLTLVGAQPGEIWVLSHEGGRVVATQGAEAPMLLTGGQIYRRYFGIEDIYPDGLGRSLQRYGFLSGYGPRSDSEEAELVALHEELRVAELDPGWEVVARVPIRPKENGSDEGSKLQTAAEPKG